MTDLRQAAKQALVALIDAANVLSAPMFADAADALRKALEQPEQRPWVDMTDEEMDTAVNSNITITDSRLRDGVYGVALDIAALLKGKNT